MCKNTNPYKSYKILKLVIIVNSYTVIMSTTIFFFIFSSFFFLDHHALADDESKDINWWCNTTPHPEQCKYFMGRDPECSKPKSRQDFRTMTIKVAMERALDAQTHAQSLGQGCRSKRRLVAWRDCRNLIDDTIIQLNSTLQGINTNDSFTDFDAQTWLSTALTYIGTCRTGSLELNVSKFISPIVSGNVSELLSNSLAINGGLLGQEPEQKDDEFPSWVTSHERKLLADLQLASRANVIVAKDGSGAFRSIQAAINYATSRRVGNGRVVIYIKRGVYRENIAINRNMNKVTLVGDGLRYTIITGSRSVPQGFTTYSSATVGVDGIGFIARGITFRNTAGQNNGQAVALRSASDLSVFYACSFEGYQDTLFVHAQRQFYKTCYIYGTIDFIFGNAAVVFQNCIIYVRRPLVGQANVITAQGRGDPFQNSGISIQNSRIMAAPDLKPVVAQFKTYLGRPWQQYSRTVILKSFIDSLVSPDGWLRWQDSNFALSTLYYGEYHNFGPAAGTRNRVKWPGYHVITSANVASRFTVSNLIAGGAWLPSTGVPFTAGL
ncbi:probable pectinesterase/pectinesterase inhibitor 59 [Olea europaea var. sylvestris]|uniref:probable pectinesterase/pectinesterase inhibitor 59 n=1 Tax=Olea europaea var. sylvestris TaxID=158386 RepID=UPI000C1D0A2A|nr:probable pectinesterase/pectinesterase inhibitor 59 [Olea europaea var. sylvestris]